MSAADVNYFYTAWIRKAGRAVHLGHRDYARTIQRALRRSGLPLRMTQGFHPHPKMLLPEPLPLGVGSEGEAFVVALLEEVPRAVVQHDLGEKLSVDLALIRTEVGRRPEPRDTPLTLWLEGVPTLEDRLAGLNAEALGLAEYRLERGSGSGVQVRLTPHPDRRVSVGRLIRTLAESGPAARSITRVHAGRALQED